MSLRAIAGLEAPTASAGEFTILCRSLMAGGSLGAAAALAEGWRATPRVLSVLKGAVNAGGLDSTWGAELSTYNALITAFLGSLRHAGAFDRMVGDMVKIPLRTTAAVATASMSASTVGQGMIKPITSMTFSATEINELKVVAIVIATKEFMARGGAVANAILERELRGAIAAETDAEFLRQVADGSTTAATGIDARSVRRDVSTALAAMSTTPSSKVYALMQPAMLKKLCGMFTADGAAAFPTLRIDGGELLGGLPALPCDAVTSGSIICIDATQIAAASETITLKTVDQGDVILDTAPDSPAVASSAWISLWSTNQIALVAERYFAAYKMGSTSVQEISNSAYGDSPAP